MLHKIILQPCKARIILKKAIFNVRAPCYGGWLAPHIGGLLQIRKFWFCLDDINQCVRFQVEVHFEKTKCA
jgi:hypothetical protein